MSVTDELSNEVVVEYVRKFPLGRTQGQVHKEFDQFSTGAVDSVLDGLQTKGVILYTGGKFRWTG
jgi:hypothetical protein